MGKSLCKLAHRLPETPTADKPPKRLPKQQQRSMKSPLGGKKPVFAIVPGLGLGGHPAKPHRSGSVTSSTGSEEQISVVENQGLAGLAQLLKNKSLKVGSFLPMIGPPLAQSHSESSQPQSVPGFGGFRRDLSSLSWLEGLQGAQVFRPEDQQGKKGGGSLASRREGRGAARGGGGGARGEKVKPLKLKPAEVLGHHRPQRKKSESGMTSPEIPKQDAAAVHLSDILTGGHASHMKGSVAEPIVLLDRQRETAEQEKEKDCLVVSIARTVVNAQEKAHVSVGEKTIPGISESGSESARDFEAAPVQFDQSQIGVGGLRAPEHARGTELPLGGKSESGSGVLSLDSVLIGKTQSESTPSQSSEDTLTASESQGLDDLESSLSSAPGLSEKRPGTGAEDESHLSGEAGERVTVAAAIALPCESMESDVGTGVAPMPEQLQTALPSQTETPCPEPVPALKSPTIVTMFAVPGPTGSADGGSTSLSPRDVPQSDSTVPAVPERNQIGQLTLPSPVVQSDSSLACPAKVDPLPGARNTCSSPVTEPPAETSSELVAPVQPSTAESGIPKPQVSCSDDHSLPQSDSPPSDDLPSKVPKSPALQRLADSSCASSPNGEGSPHWSSPLKDIPMRHLQLKLKPVREMSPRKRRLSMEQGEHQLEEGELQMEQGGLQLETNQPDKGGPQLEKGGPQLESEDSDALICLPKRRKLVGSSCEEATDSTSASTHREDDMVSGEPVSTESGVGVSRESGMDVDASFGGGEDGKNVEDTAAEHLEKSRQELGASSGDPQAPSLAAREQLDVAELLTMLQETPQVFTAGSNSAATIEATMSLQDAEIAAASQVLEGVHAPAAAHQVPDLQMLLEAALMDASVEGGQQLEQRMESSGGVISEGRYAGEDARTNVGEGELTCSDLLSNSELQSHGFGTSAVVRSDLGLGESSLESRLQERVPGYQESSVTDTTQDAPMSHSAPTCTIPSYKDSVCVSPTVFEPSVQPQAPMDTGTGTEVRRLSTEAEIQFSERSAGSSNVPFPRLQTSIPNVYEPAAPIGVASLTSSERAPAEFRQVPMEVEQDACSTKEIPSSEKGTEYTHEAVQEEVRPSTTCQDTSVSAREDTCIVSGIEKVSEVPEETTARGKKDGRGGGHTPAAAVTPVIKEESEMKVEAPLVSRRRRGRKKNVEMEATRESFAEDPLRPDEGVETTPTDDGKEGHPATSTESESATTEPMSQTRDMTLNLSELKTKGRKMSPPSPGRGSGVLESSRSPMSEASTPSTIQPGSVKSAKLAKSKRPSGSAASLKLGVSVPLDRVRITHYTTIECYLPSEFAPGDIVWAKGHLLPAWPGTVISHKDRRKDRLKAAPAGQVSHSQTDRRMNK